MARRAVRALRASGSFFVKLLATLALCAVFAAAGVIGVVVHANLPAGRRIAATTVTRMLSDTFQGTVTLGTIERLGMNGLEIDEIRVIDPMDNTVLVLERVRVRANVDRILRDVLFSTNKLTIVIRHIRAERAEAQIIPDPETGIPTIERTFFLTPEPEKKREPSRPGRQVRVWMPSIEVGRVYGRGTVAGLPMMETTVANVRGSTLVTPEGVAVDVERYGVVLRGLAGADVTGTGELHIRAPGAVWTSLDGYLGDVGLNAFVYVRGDKLDITLDVPRADPDAVRALLPDWPLQEGVSVHAQASGELPILQTSGRFEIGDALVTANGPLRLSGDVGLNLDAQARGFDLRALLTGAPETSIDADAALAIWVRQGQVAVDFNGTTFPTQIEGQEVPAIDATGSYDKRGVTGKATVHEPGMPLKVGFDVRPDGRIDFDAHARRFRIEKAPRAHGVLPARGFADVRVDGSLDKGRLEANVTADVSRFEYDGVELGQGRITGTARGALDKPKQLRIDARLEGRDVLAGNFSFDRVRARATGPAARPKLDANFSDKYGPEVQASATLSTERGPALHGLDVRVQRDDASLAGKVERLDLSGREISIKDVKITGAGGELVGSVRVGKDQIELRARGEGVDLERAARALGLPRGMVGGKLNVDADVSIGKQESRGRVKIALGDGTVMALGGIALALDAKLDGTSLDGSASAMIRDLGALGAAWETTLAGSPLKLESWRDMIGSAQLNAINVELSHLKHLLPKTARIERVGGQGFAQLAIERRIPAALPSVLVIAGTQGLEVVRGSPEPTAKPLHIKGIDLQVGGQIDGATGDSSGTTRLIDSGGVLASATGTIKLDLMRIVQAPSETGRELLSTPLDAVLVLPDRPLSALPQQIQVSSLSGVVGGRINVAGTLNEPTISGSAHVRNLAAIGSRHALPVDVQAVAQYEPKSGRAGGTVEVTQAGRRVALLLAQGRAELHGVTRGHEEDDSHWSGGAQVVLEGLPLGVFGPLADSRVGGELWGTVAVHRPEQAEYPQVSANVEVRKASVDLVPVGSGRIKLRSDGRLVNANLDFAHGSGRLTAQARAGVAWDELVPVLDASRPLHIDAQAKRFDAIVLSPFLRDVFSELSGPVNANLTAIFRKPPAPSSETGDAEPERPWESQIYGTASMQGGVMQLQALGLELRDVKFMARARNLGRGTSIDILSLQAMARSRHPNLSARGSIYIEGVRVLRGEAAINLKDVPLLLEGVSQATASIPDNAPSITAKLERQGDEMEVTVRIPALEAKLPRSAGRNVIPLDDNRAISVRQPLAEPEEPGGPAMPWRFVIDLGRNVRVIRNDLQIPISGQPVVRIGEETEVSGFVELEPGGRVQALGKVFVIESGRVRFDTDDASNPHLNATASWRAPDGSTVYVDVRGTLKESKVSFTSDPARPEPEIMALLLGGQAASTGGDDESGGGSGAAAAGSAAVGGAAPIVNELLKDSPLGAVEFRTATYEGRSSYTAAVQITQSVWFETTYRSREAADQNTDTAEDVSGTIDWRFRRNWSLRTEIGTLGTGMDLLWQYRY
jgi:translocation and assembly module TamB